MTVLITGVSGFIGSHLAKHMIDAGERVHGVCRPTSDLARVEDFRDRLAVHRVEGPVDLADLVLQVSPNKVFHAAGTAIVAGDTTNATRAIETDSSFEAALVEACARAGVPTVVLTGDAFAAGTRAAIAGASEIAITIVRLYSVYGQRDHPRRLVPQLLDAAARGTVVALSEPGIVRDWVHVDDVARLYETVANRRAECAGKAIDAGSGVATTIAALVGAVERVSDTKLDVRWGAYPTAAHDPGWWVADPAPAEQLIGWRAEMTLVDGLERLWKARAVR